MRWAPLLSSTSATAARQAIDAIAGELVSPTSYISKDEHAAVRWAERGLFYGYLAMSLKDSVLADRAVTYLNAAMAKCDTVRQCSLRNGLCGLAWIVNHLAQPDDQNTLRPESAGGVAEGRSGDTGIEGFMQTIDALLITHLSSHSAGNNYGLNSGIVGVGVYFLDRLPSPTASEGLHLVVESLECAAVHGDEGIAWRSDSGATAVALHDPYPSDVLYNLGVSEGIPGVIQLLSQLCVAGIQSDKCYCLLAGAVEWLLAQPTPIHGVSRFGPWISKGYCPRDARLAWCQGDLGIAAMLLQVGAYLNRQDWSERGYALLERCLIWPADQSGVIDSTLCHGAAGVAHVFNRIYHQVGDQRCRDAAIAWFDWALSMRQPGVGLAGFVSMASSTPTEPPLRRVDASFHSGAVGIGLAFLAAITDLEPEWDRVLLLSTRQRAPKDRKH